MGILKWVRSPRCIRVRRVHIRYLAWLQSEPQDLHEDRHELPMLGCPSTLLATLHTLLQKGRNKAAKDLRLG